MKTKLFLIALIIIVASGAIYYQTSSKKDSIQATFKCSDGKSIKAEFLKEKVKLSLSDKRNFELLQTMSGSGARYANKDESFVFWNKGNTAFIEEGNKTTFADCVDITNN